MPEPFVYLAAAPKEPVDVPTLTRDQGVRQLLEQPPHGRDGGWNLVTLARAELRPGQRLHIQDGDRKFVDLQEDGTFTVIAAFDGFLGHGRWNFAQQPKVNGFAVIEFTHEFVSLYERVLHGYLEPLPAEVRFAIGVRNAHFQQDGEERKLLLSPGPVGDRGFDRPREALRTTFDDAVDVTTSAEEPHIDVGAIAYQLVRRLYNSFGLTDDDIPYTNETRDTIDITQIRRG